MTTDDTQDLAEMTMAMDYALQRAWTQFKTPRAIIMRSDTFCRLRNAAKTQMRKPVHHGEAVAYYSGVPIVIDDAAMRGVFCTIATD